MADTLAVDLFINDRTADAVLNANRAKLQKFGADVEKIRPNLFGHFDRTFGAIQTRAEQARDQLNKTFSNERLGLAAGVGVGIAAGLAVKGINDAIKASFEGEKANRLLSASATQAGLSYQFLAEQSQKYAAEAGVSQTAAANATSQIARLGAAIGKTSQQDLQKIQTAVLDLASARGIAANQLETIINAVVTGSSDEPLNAIGLKDPGALAQDYADKVGKSVDSLSKQEQVLSRLNPLLEQAGIFTGANADKLKSLTGQAEQAQAKIEDFYTNLGNGITRSQEFRDFLTTVNGLLADFTTNVTTVQQKLAQGFSPKQLAEDDANKTGSQIIDTTKNVLTAVNPLTSLLLLYDTATEGAEVANARFIASISGAKDRRIAALTEAFEAEQNLLETQNKAAIANAEKLAAERSKNDLKSFLDSIKSENDSKRKAFEQKISNTGSDDVGANRKLLQELTQKSFLFDDADFTRKFSDIEKRITQSIDTGKKKVEELGKTYNNVLDGLVQRTNSNNPFVQLYSEADKSLQTLRENTRGLSADIISQFERMEQKAASLKLFEARIDNSLGAFNLRDEAANFRNPFDEKKTAQTQQEIINDFLRKNPNFLNLNRGKSGEEIGRDILSRSQLGRNTLESPQDRINKKLAEQTDLIFNGRLNDEEQRIADRKFIGLTQGLNPNELSGANREAAAAAREREALRLDSAEADAKVQRDTQTKLQTEIRDELQKLNKVAESGGIAAVVRILDESNGAASVSGVPKSPTARDVELTYPFDR